MPFFNNPLSFPFTCSSSLDFSPILISFSVQIFFLLSTCIVKILRTRKLYPVRFITQLVLWFVRLVLLPDLATTNYSKSFSIIRNDLRLLEMNFSHSKNIFTLLVLRPLNKKILRDCSKRRIDFDFSLNKCPLFL